MHAFLLINTNPEDFAKGQNAKLMPFVLQKIEDARELKKLVKFSFAEKTAIVINDIDSATNEALNAFLKNLEEPNENLIYILTANNLNNVLPTIVSRCEVIQVKQVLQVLQVNKDIKQFLKESLNKRFEIVGKIKEREEAIKFVEDLILVSNVRVRPSHMENYLKTLINLKSNGNVSLQLTNLVAKMNGHG